jgi:hypothetical protein
MECDPTVPEVFRGDKWGATGRLRVIACRHRPVRRFMLSARRLKSHLFFASGGNTLLACHPVSV